MISKGQLCEHCRGSGGEDPDDVKKCPRCQGQGFRMVRQQVAPGFIQQFQMECEHCSGEGKVITTKCHVCHGKKVFLCPLKNIAR